MSRWVIILLLMLVVMWALIPPLLTLQTSFMTAYVFINPLRAISRMSLANWRYMPYRLILKWIRNSLFVCGISSLLATFTCMLAGFGFAKYNFRGKNVIFWLFLVSMMVPITVLFLPRFLIVRNLGMFDSFAGMIAPMLIYPAGVFFARQYISRISGELAEAARIDGASEFQIFRHIIIPLTHPLLAILILFTFMNTWHQFMWQFLVARNAEIQTLMVGLGSFLRGLGTGGEFAITGTSPVSLEGLQATASIILALPPMLIFILGQRYFLTGLIMGGGYE